jgi:hypothetical protein
MESALGGFKLKRREVFKHVHSVADAATLGLRLHFIKLYSHVHT